ncbi:pseudaminic acid synthase [Alphaproteobacteria bacterium HT1-32]|nr:pseudaminic acid synthase [Alphaproteobacteria bacterium HT1-32]
MDIAGRQVGPGAPPYIVAEMSGNHNGDLGRALEIIRVIGETGADAVKIQTYTADTITIDHDSPEFRIETGGLWDGRSLYDLYDEAHTPWDWHQAMFDCARDAGLAIFSAPFDHSAVDFLEDLNCPAYKIASFEIVDLPLIAKTAATGKPLIISTGMAVMEEIREAVAVARKAGATDIAVLHCVSGYPTPASESNLATIPHLAAELGVQIGLSDHTLGTAVPVAAVALGATIIEKHVTLRRSDGGPDSAFSLEPDELARMVEDCRTASLALGKAGYHRKPSEEKNTVFRRSVYVVSDIRAGETIQPHHIRSIRPGYGIPPKHIEEILGRTAATDLKRGTALKWDMIAD